MKAFVGLALAGLTVLGCALDAGAAEIKVTINQGCDVKVDPLTGTRVFKKHGDVITWHFVNGCRKEHKVFVCPILPDGLLGCGGPPPATIRSQFKLPAAAATGTATTPTFGIAGCHVDYSVVPVATSPPVKFKYCVVTGEASGPDLDCSTACASPKGIRASELEINVEP